MPAVEVAAARLATGPAAAAVRRTTRYESVSSDGGWMRCAASRLVCIYIVHSVLFPGPGPAGPLPPCQSFPVPLPELGYAHCAEPTGGTRPGGTCQPVSLRL